MKDRRIHQFPDIWKTIDQIKNTLQVPHSEMAEFLGLPVTRYQKMKSKELPLSLVEATALVKKLNLSLEAFVYNQIDYLSLAEHHSGNLNYIPKKYLFGAYSKRRTVTGFLDYIEYLRGSRVRGNILRHFQITEASLENGEKPINIIFMQDLFKLIRKDCFGDLDYINIGAFSAVANKGSPLHHSLLMTNSISEAYEHLIVDLVRYYEHNCDYRLVKLTSEGCVVESTPSQSLVDAHQNYNIGSREICLCRSGILTSVPTYINEFNSKVIETRCIHQGDPICSFEVQYNRAKRPSSSLVETLQ